MLPAAEYDRMLDRVEPERRAEVLERLAAHFDEPVIQQSPRASGVFDELVFRLLKDIGVEARVMLAERIATVPAGPVRTVRLLALDVEPAVAGPVLRASPLISDEDLAWIARERGQEHLLAIAERQNLSEKVTTILVERGEGCVLLTIAENMTAALSRRGQAELVNKAMEDAPVNAALLNRGDFPADLVTRLTAQARRQAREVSGTGPISLDAAGPGDAGRRGTPADAANRAQAAAEQMIAAVAARRPLNEEDIVALMRISQWDPAAVVLARLSRHSVDQAMAALSADQLEPLLMLLRLANVQWGTAEQALALVMARTGVRRSIADYRAPYLRLSRSTAERALSALQTRPTDIG